MDKIFLIRPTNGLASVHSVATMCKDDVYERLVDKYGDLADPLTVETTIVEYHRYCFKYTLI